MKHSDYLKKKKTRETRKKIISVISAIVVFVTTYALVLPAITLDVSKASQEPGIAFEQMQFKATAAAASVTAADSTVEVKVEEAQVEEPEAEAPAEETIQEEPAESSEEEASAVSDEQEEIPAEPEQEEIPAEPEQVETPAEPEQEEAPAAEAETKEVQADKSADSEPDAAPSSEPAHEDAQTAETQKAAEQTAVDQSGTGTTDAATTAETAAEFQIPALDALDFDDLLTGKTAFYYYHPENAEEAENLSSDSIEDWKKVGSDTVLAPEDFVRVYLSYEIPAGALNETNTEVRYRLPADLELSDRQIKAINKYENGIAASKSGSEHDKYLGAEAIEGSRTPDEKADDEYISATVKVEKTENDRQELVFTFIPYTVEKNQVSYDEKGEVKSKGKEVKGFFSFDLKTSQIDFEKTSIEIVEKEDGTTEEIQYSQAKVVFADKENNWIERALTLAGPVEKEEAQTAEPKTLTTEGADYTVTVSYTDDAQIPDNAELKVSEIGKETPEYAAYLEQAKGAVDDETKSVNEARFFDITISADGEKIEPQAPVNVQITFAGIEQTNTDDTQLLHYKEDKEVEVMDKAEFSKSEEPENEAKAVDTVQFETEGFSVYGIVGTEAITSTFLTADGKTLKVTINYDEKAQIPEGATLEVKEIREGDKGWIERSVRLAETLRENYGNVTLSDARFLSICIMVDGKEYEPKAPVQVKIEYVEPFITEDTIDYGYDEVLGGKIVPKEKANRFVAIHYTDKGTDLIESNNTLGEDGFTETIYDVDGFSDYDLVYMYDYDTYEAGDDYNPSSHIHTAEIVQAAATDEKAPAGPLRNAGDVPEHSKTLIDNQNGTYNIGLNVRGDADTDSTHASNVNVVMIYDVSTSMTYNYVPMATGGRGLDTSSATSYQDGEYFQLYSRNGSNYTALTNDNYSGTVFRRTRTGYGQQYTYTEYTGQRYSYNVYRADAGEKVLYDFVHALYGYQNADDPSNIQAAVVTFAGSASTFQGWTYSEEAIVGTQNNQRMSWTGAAGSRKMSYANYTNWQAALQQAQSLLDNVPDKDPTYVVFITDGRPQTSGSTDAYQNYRNAADEAAAIQNYCASTKGAMYGIYAYGKEQDWLASLMYSAYNNQARPSSDIEGETFDTEGYYKASDSEALTEAINEIFQRIVQTLGVTDVAITDGTTSRVQTSAGVAHLLEVDTSSYQYWLTFPGLTAGQGGTYTFSMVNPKTATPVQYNVTVNGGNVTITWTDPEDNSSKTATYPGKINAGNTLTIEWTRATSFYNYAPPAASFTNGSVDWNLHPVGTLLDNVQYTVTFDCYPSQETLDLIADLKNGDVKYSDLDPEIQKYLGSDYKLKTNTTAVLSYTDTRTEAGPKTSEYVNPDPQPVSATEEVAVSKKWNNTLDDRQGWKQDLMLYVTREGIAVHGVELNLDNQWTNTAWLSYGILTEDSNGVHLKTTGHHYSFSEDVETGYYWVIKAPTVRPMLVNNEIKLLKLLDAKTDTIPDAITGASGDNARAVDGNDTYYKLTIDGNVYYYVVIPDLESALTATNHRRSYLDVVKTITGNNVPKGDKFPFTIKVENSNAETSATDDTHSDAWVWFSIWDTEANAMLTDPDAATAEGIRWQLNDDPENGTVVTEKPDAADFNGYFCVPSGNSITVDMQSNYSLRFLNLPDGTKYSVSESTTMPKDGYSFVSIAGERGYDADGKEETEDWTTETTGTPSGQSISGTIDYVESAYKVTVTNKWNTIDVKLKKVDEADAVLDGSTFALTSGETTVGTYSPDSTTEDGNPIDLGGLGIGIYKLEETVVPTNYTGSEDVYFQVYKDTDGTLKARLVDAGGAVLADQSAISSETGTDGLIYTITVQNTLKTATVKVTKNVVGLEGDQSKEFAFTTTGVAAQEQTANLTNGQSVTYTEVPYGSSVTVDETADNSFDTTYSVNGADAVSGTRATFTVDDTTVTDGVAEVIFTNTRSKQLIKVYKYETGNEDNGLEGAVFTLTGPDGSGISYTGLETNGDGYLENDDSVYIELPVNTGSYTLTETKAPDGYNMLTENVVFTVTTSGVSATGSGYSVTSATETVDGVSAMVYTIKVQNSTGVELPMTGGSGTFLYTLGGIALIMASALMYGFRMRRRERRLN